MARERSRARQPTGRRPRGRGKPARGRAARTRTRRRFPVGRVLKWAFTLVVWLVLIGGAGFVWLAWDLPDVDRLGAQTRRPGVVLLTASGDRLASYGDLYGARVGLDQLPPYLPRAVLATEDRRFYGHFGLDPRGIARAMVANLRERRIVQGGSTITQQLAKNLFLTPERSLERKAKEALLALRLEANFDKDELLAIYLNRVYLGGGAYGVEAAAQKYFGHSSREISLYEAAMLAGLLRAPSRNNPLRDPQAAHARTLTVLGTMVAVGYLSPEAAAAAGRQRSAYRGGEVEHGSSRLYFTDWIMQQVAGFVGLSDGDLIVETTFDPRLQNLAERTVAEGLRGPAGDKAGQAALVAMTPDGAIRAMVGGRDYRSSQFNRATQALRQPGSAFKPFVYLAAVEAGFTPDTKVEDAPITVDGWSPRNNKGTFHGTVTLREAMARSLNSVAVRVSEAVGRKQVVTAARRLGITSDLTSHPSLALGTSELTLAELTAAYAVFANGGRGVLPYGIREIRDGADKVLYRRGGAGPGRVVESRHVAEVNDLLGAVVSWGTGTGARIGRPAAGKTGTSQDARDAWFIGYSRDLVAGVWLGNDDGRPMSGMTGAGAPARIWGAFMAAAHDDVPVQPLPGLVRPEKLSSDRP